MWRKKAPTESIRLQEKLKFWEFSSLNWSVARSFCSAMTSQNPDPILDREK